jgi:hypothetical protein
VPETPSPADTAPEELPPEGSVPHPPPPGLAAPDMPPTDSVRHVPPSGTSVPQTPSPKAQPPETPGPNAVAAAPGAPPEEPALRDPRHGLAWLVALAILLLAASQAALWYRVLSPPPGSGSLDQRVQAIEARVAALEHRPAQVVAGQPGQAGAPGAPGVAPDLGPLEARIAALEQRPPVAAPNPNDSLGPRLSADEARLATLEKTAQVPAQLAERANRIARIQAAFIALSVGQPLGDLPSAPSALARYATAAPPTEATLRLSFPPASQAALAADHPVSGEKPFLQRVWAEAQDLVTIRQGEHVLVGDPAAGVLAHAQAALDAGDLAGAIAAAATLSGPAAQALAPWLDQARGLLAARAALAALAAQT